MDHGPQPLGGCRSSAKFLQSPPVRLTQSNAHRGDIVAFIKKTARYGFIAVILLTFIELTLNFADQFSSSVSVMQAVSKSPDKVAGISAKAPDLEAAVANTINLDPDSWQSFLQSLELRLQNLSLDSIFNSLFDLSDSPFGWVLIGLVGWRVVWKVSNPDSAVKL